MLVFPSFLFRLQKLNQNLVYFLHRTTFSNICSMFQPLNRGPTSLQRNKLERPATKDPDSEGIAETVEAAAGFSSVSGHFELRRKQSVNIELESIGLRDPTFSCTMYIPFLTGHTLNAKYFGSRCAKSCASPLLSFSLSFLILGCLSQIHLVISRSLSLCLPQISL